MRTIIAGIGVQGAKRMAVAGADAVATVDPVADGVDFRDIRDVPLDSYDAALLCIPDEAKIELLDHLLSAGKHVLVEKPVLAAADDDLIRLAALAEKTGAVCYTAYNHRFEPHFVHMRDLIRSGRLGKIYSLRMFYGNGTARLVRDSAWRDQGAGVLPDLGSHLLDTLRFWFGDDFDASFRIRGAYRHDAAPRPRRPLSAEQLGDDDGRAALQAGVRSDADAHVRCLWPPALQPGFAEPARGTADAFRDESPAPAAVRPALPSLPGARLFPPPDH